MSAVFDRYAIVDWSAANTPVTGKDSVWICFAERDGGGVRLLGTSNPATRAAAMAELRGFFRDSLAARMKVFAGFDFPFGYPAGAAALIGGEPGWRPLWAKLAEVVRDSDGNSSNRFEVGGIFNRGALNEAPMFWGRPAHQDIPGLPATRPLPYPAALPERRLAELRAPRAQPVWKLAYAGSVGSQAILGIAHLERLRQDPEFGGSIAIWPFETGFAADLSAPIVLAEIYPGAFPIEIGNRSCIDEAQVASIAEGFAALDARGAFAGLLARPADLSEEQVGDVLREEGWIAGLGFDLAEAEPARSRLAYLRDPEAIYAASFAAIRAEADLDRVPPEARDLAIRLIHACGMVEIAGDLVVSPGAMDAGREALRRGAPVLCDAEMVAQGIIRRSLPAGNRLVCRLNEASVPQLAKRLQTTRSAAQVELWDDQLEGAVVAIGNAPTALFRLLERLDEGAPRPALILGFPVGFVGAAESKEELIRDCRGIPFITLRGRRGGSALAAAAVNAIAAGLAETASGTPLSNTETA